MGLSCYLTNGHHHRQVYPRPPLLLPSSDRLGERPLPLRQTALSGQSRGHRPTLRAGHRSPAHSLAQFRVRRNRRPLFCCPTTPTHRHHRSACPQAQPGTLGGAICPTGHFQPLLGSHFEGPARSSTTPPISSPTSTLVPRLKSPSAARTRRGASICDKSVSDYWSAGIFMFLCFTKSTPATGRTRWNSVWS